MKIILDAAVIWIKAEFGGRTKAPVIGLKPNIRFQKYISNWLNVAWDVKIIDLDFDTSTWAGLVKMEFTKNASPKIECLKKGELIELLDGYRVIAVGKIIDVSY